ncbi:MAG: Calx-beta domain-containing protein, partial [Candidatus Promineifilaceae bacterium]
ATPGEDYAPLSGTLTFSAGQTAKTITVTIYGDTRFEGDELLDVALSQANPVGIDKETSAGRILNDDAASFFIYLSALER